MTRRLTGPVLSLTDILRPSRSAAHDTSAPDDTLQMNEDDFRVFYTRTSGAVWSYLARATGDRTTADDLLQDAYFRLLRTTTPFESDEHRKNYLFRIATNLLRDRYRRPSLESHQLPERDSSDIPATGDLAKQTQQRTDLQRAMARLTARERELLLLAYGLGSTHKEIAGSLGLKIGSIKPLLFRARRKLAKLLRS